MARKYKRSKNGQFAGGGGGGSTASKGASAKPKAATKSSQKPKSMAGKRKSTKRQKVLKFVAQNPQLVVGLAGTTTMMALNGRMAINSAVAAKKVSNSEQFANNLRAAARGLSSNVGSQGLKASKQNRKGVYKL